MKTACARLSIESIKCKHVDAHASSPPERMTPSGMIRAGRAGACMDGRRMRRLNGNREGESRAPLLVRAERARTRERSYFHYSARKSQRQGEREKN
eukprot:2512090-Pleurochrysis_carterae.AAC.2